jgi:hypothetical protein
MLAVVFVGSSCTGERAPGDAKDAQSCVPLTRHPSSCRVSSAEKTLKGETEMEEEHAAHMADMQRQLDAERESSAALVDSAIAGVESSYGKIESDDEWPGAGRWTPPDEPVKTDVFEWPAPPGMKDDALNLFARAPRAQWQQMLLQRGLTGGMQRHVARTRLPVLLTAPTHTYMLAAHEPSDTEAEDDDASALDDDAVDLSSDSTVGEEVARLQEEAAEADADDDASDLFRYDPEIARLEKEAAQSDAADDTDAANF